MTEQDKKHEDNSADITPEEREMLENEGSTRRVTPDITDDEGDMLNEGTGSSGRDLDIPGAELDDDNEDIGEEDEENNYYSQSDNQD